MASGSDSDSSDNTSSSELSEHNAADDSENEEGKDFMEENNTDEKPCDSNNPKLYHSEHKNSLKVPGTYVPLQVKGGLVLEHISDEDEIWMMQCPVFINPADLRGKKIIFGGTSEFAIKQKNGEQQMYETSSYTGMNKPFACLLPTTKSTELVAKVIEPAGLIVIKEKICIPDLDDDDDDDPVPKKRNLIIPKDLKIRHPLFGSEYEQELDARRTQFDDSIKKKKKKKKHKDEDKSDINHKRKTSDDEIEYERKKIKEEPGTETSEDCNSVTHKRKKKKKSKNRESEEVPSEEYVVKQEENVLKKKKKSKKKSRESV